MYNLNRKAILALFLIFFSNNIIFPGNHSVESEFIITGTSINRYLNNQYNTSSFPREFTVTGTPYKIFLTLPEVILTPGNAKLLMTFDIKQGDVLLYHFEIKPSLSISNSQVSGSDIKAFLTDLQMQLNAVSPILPGWVKENIINKYNLIGWIVYPSKLMDKISESFLSEKGISIVLNDFTLSSEIIDDAFKLVVSLNLTAKEASFFAQLTTWQNRIYVTIVSNDIDVIIDKVTLYREDTNIIQEWNDDVSIKKGETKSLLINDANLDPASGYPIWILFKTEYSFKVRKYLSKGPHSEQVGSIN